VKAGHEIPDLESIVERNDRYFVVETPERVAHVVE
jgi:hypothetical protein